MCAHASEEVDDVNVAFVGENVQSTFCLVKHTPEKVQKVHSFLHIYKIEFFAGC